MAEDLIVEMPAPLRQACEKTPSWPASSPSVPLPHLTPPHQASSLPTASMQTHQRISRLQRIRSRGGKAVAVVKSSVDNDADDKECSRVPLLRTEQARGVGAGGRERGRSKNHHNARQRAKSMIRPPLCTEDDGHFFACPVCQTSNGETDPGKCPDLGIKMPLSPRIAIPQVCNNTMRESDCGAEFYPGGCPIPSVTTRSRIRSRTGRGQEDPRCRRSRSEVRCEIKENFNENKSFIVDEKTCILPADSRATAAYSEPKNLLRSYALNQNTEDGISSGGRKRRRRRTYRNCGRLSRDRSKSKTHFPENDGYLTAWPGKNGVWLPM